MNRDLELKLQAYLDGELGKRDAVRVEDWLQGNEEGQSLLAELRMIKGAMAGAELPRPLPEAGDFYWSKIQREIARVDREQEYHIEPGWLTFFRRLSAPAAGVALVLLLTLVTVKTLTPDGPAGSVAIVETPSEEIGAYSFRSESENMFVVWVYDRTPAPDEEAQETREDF